MKFFKKYILLTVVLFWSSIVLAGNPIRIEVTTPQNINAGSDFVITIEIQKNSILGFSKLELFLPVGFKPTVINSSGATCVIQNELLKMIWIELPGEKVFNVSIAIKVDPRIYGYKEMYGNFHYVDGKERMKAPIGIIPFNIKNENKNSSSLVNDDLAMKNLKKVMPSKSLSNSLVYRVQVAAYKRRINKDILLELYGVPAYMKEDVIDNLYKYTIGDFVSKEDADIFRQTCGVTGAFVVAYENGKRVVNK